MSTLFKKAVQRIPAETKATVSKSLDIVDQICYVLEKKGMTQKDLAEALNKSESEVSKWMRGTHNFTIETIAKIETVLCETIIVTPLRTRVVNSLERTEMSLELQLQYLFSIKAGEIFRRNDLVKQSRTLVWNGHNEEVNEREVTVDFVSRPAKLNWVR